MAEFEATCSVTSPATTIRDRPNSDGRTDERTVEWPDDATVSAVARAIFVERFKDRKLTGEPTDADVDQVRHLAEAALRAIANLRTVADAADVPVRAVASNKADGSIVARFDEENGGVVFGDGAGASRCG